MLTLILKLQLKQFDSSFLITCGLSYHWCTVQGHTVLHHNVTGCKYNINRDVLINMNARTNAMYKCKQHTTRVMSNQLPTLAKYQSIRQQLAYMYRHLIYYSIHISHTLVNYNSIWQLSNQLPTLAKYNTAAGMYRHNIHLIYYSIQIPYISKLQHTRIITVVHVPCWYRFTQWHPSKRHN